MDRKFSVNVDGIYVKDGKMARETKRRAIHLDPDNQITLSFPTPMLKPTHAPSSTPTPTQTPTLAPTLIPTSTSLTQHQLQHSPEISS